jgi:uncharacterized protein YuzE
MAESPIDYDKEEDVLYVLLKAGTKVARSHSLDDMRLIDYSEDGGVVGIEFIDASHGVDLSEVPFARKVEQLIGEAGLGLPIFA